MTIVEMTISDYEEAIALWSTSEGVTLREADSREYIVAYLRRNPGTCFVARESGRLIGAVLCGHDGRHGYLHHLAVAADWRRHGIGSALVERCIAALWAEGILKCHVFVRTANLVGRTFWNRASWTEREEIVMMSRMLAVSENM